MLINSKEYKEVVYLGKGKSGFSYLVEDDLHNHFVAKKIHHEPCDYYNFSNKLHAEITDYNRLINIISVPKLIDVDYKNEIILKEYIEGKTIQELLNENVDISIYKNNIFEIVDICYKNNINIDYYPTNFIFKNNILYYIDYECNEYSEEWNFENWGNKYWCLK